MYVNEGISEVVRAFQLGDRTHLNNLIDELQNCILACNLLARLFDMHKVGLIEFGHSVSHCAHKEDKNVPNTVDVENKYRQYSCGLYDLGEIMYKLDGHNICFFSNLLAHIKQQAIVQLPPNIMGFFNAFMLDKYKFPDYYVPGTQPQIQKTPTATPSTLGNLDLTPQFFRTLNNDCENIASLARYSFGLKKHAELLAAKVQLLKAIALQDISPVSQFMQQHLCKQFPIILICDQSAETRIACVSFRSQEYRAHSTLVLGEDIKCIATDTEDNRLKLLDMLATLRLHGITVILFNNLVESQSTGKEPVGLTRFYDHTIVPSTIMQILTASNPELDGRNLLQSCYLRFTTKEQLEDVVRNLLRSSQISNHEDVRAILQFGQQAWFANTHGPEITFASLQTRKTMEAIRALDDTQAPSQNQPKLIAWH